MEKLSMYSTTNNSYFFLLMSINTS